MLFYNWQKINKYSNGKVQIIKAIFQSIMNCPLPSFGRLTYDKIDFDGDSYLINPEALLNEFHTGDQVDAANYLMLASRRNVAEYFTTGDNTLPLKYIAIPKHKLEKNSLIEIIDTNIHFKLEK